MVWLNPTAERRRYFFDHGYTLFGLFSAGTAEVEREIIESGADMVILQYALTSLEVLPLEKLTSNTSSTSNGEGRAAVLEEAIRSMGAPLRRCSKTRFEVSLKAGKVCRCFSKLVSYCGDSPEAEDMSSARHGAGR